MGLVDRTLEYSLDSRRGLQDLDAPLFRGKTASCLCHSSASRCLGALADMMPSLHVNSVKEFCSLGCASSNAAQVLRGSPGDCVAD